MSTIAEHIANAVVNDQVSVTHTAYTGVPAGMKTGWIVAKTATHVTIASSVRGTTVATVPIANVTAFAAGRGWRNA